MNGAGHFLMTNALEIQQFRLSDQDALLSFLRVAYADDPRRGEPNFWKWHYLQNPYTAPDDIPLWVVKNGPGIVGQLATIPVELKAGSKQTRAIWILDFILDAAHRGRGLGKRLVQAAGERYPTMITLGINEASTRVFRSLGWVSLGSIHRYHKLLFPGNAVKGIASLPPFREGINFLAAPFRPRPARIAGTPKYSARARSQFDSGFDDLWQRASPQWPCVVHRSSAFLRWQFLQQPAKKFEVIGLFENTQLLGYAVLYFRKLERAPWPPKAAISDLFYAPENSREIVDALLASALKLALERRAGSLVTDVLDPLVEERLHHFGFSRIKKSPEFMATAMEQRELICNPTSWFLTRADSDVSIMEHPNLLSVIA